MKPTTWLSGRGAWWCQGYKSFVTSREKSPTLRWGKPDLVVSHGPQSQEQSSAHSYLTKDLTSSQEDRTGKDRALYLLILNVKN